MSHSASFLKSHFESPRLTLFLASILLIIIFYQFFFVTSDRDALFVPQTSRNSVAEGILDGTLTIPIDPPQRLSGLSVDQIKRMRIESVSPYIGTVVNSYEPSDQVFGRLKDGLPWFGMDNFYRLGQSSSEHLGSSTESIAIANPFLLVVPEFWTLGIWGNPPIVWKSLEIPPTPEVLAPLPKQIKWNGIENVVTIEYDITSYLEMVKQFLVQAPTDQNLEFGITAYNAVDFGFHYIRFSQEKSEAVDATKGMIPTKITDYLGGMKNVCGSACNHHSNPMVEFDTFKVSSLPASGVFDLWKDNPVTSEGQEYTKPNFSVRINLR